MLGDTLDSIGQLMLDSDITELVNNYTTSIFSNEQNTNKIRYIKELIYSTQELEKIEKYNVLLDKVIAAEEVRILGKILKINQGLPTNTTDTYSYIKSIEKYIESRYNKDFLEPVENSLIELIVGIKSGEDTKAISKTYKNLKSEMEENWVKFDLIKFILNPEYKQEQINKYEKYKVNFNILEVISEVPHFKEMFNVLALNKQILNSLSTRNRLEDIVLNQLNHSSDKGKLNVTKALNKQEIRTIKDAIDDHLINSWIISKNISITIPPNADNNPAQEVLTLENSARIIRFREYVENYVVPLLKQKLPNNRFISLLTFGLKKGIPFYKLPFNMTQIDNTQKTRSLYEEALYAFNNLSTIKVDETDMNLVDLFYLYNLIVNKDKFGPNSLTRIFEDLISTSGGENFLVYDFNSWIDNQDILSLVNTFPITDINMMESTPVIEDVIEVTDNDTDTSNIGFKETLSDNDIEEAKLEENADILNNKLTTLSNLEKNKSVTYYDTKPSVESKLISLIKTANMKGLHVIYDADLVNEDSVIRNAKGFVRNGKIYINADRATDDTVIHEFGHLYLADAKLQHPNEYYQLLTKVKDTEFWKLMRDLPEYVNKRGSDFDEEVLASLIDRSYNEGLEGVNHDIVVEALNLVSQEYKDFIKSDILPVLDDAFISNYKEQQKLATIKNKLINDDIIKENCK